MKGRIYLSGAITGNPNYKKEFARAACRLRKNGCRVVNPAAYPVHKNWTWEDYMRRDIKFLMKCTAVVMVNDWKNSKGACLERHIAMELGMMTVDFSNLV